MPNRRIALAWLVAVSGLASCRGDSPRPAGAGAPAGAPAGTPVLAVVVVVDQMRGDYLDRFGSKLDGGFARLAREGVVFTDAHQDHALTATGPGHATLFTGVCPALNGIIGNAWFDRGAGARSGCVVDGSAPAFGGHGSASPAKLTASTLGEWLQEATPDSRVAALSGKDRGAVLPAGRSKNAAVFWYDSHLGGFTTSTAYARELPDYVTKFNAAHGAKGHLCESWEPLDGPGDLPLADPDDSAWEPAEGRTFPHPLPCDRDRSSGVGGHPTPASEQPAEARIGSEIAMTPLWDEMALDFAEKLIANEQLGQDDSPDLLVLALSGTDYIGHSYGPDSQELLDQLRRLDRKLGVFLEHLDRSVGLDRVVVAVSADHGVQAAPERGAALGYRRVDPDQFLKRVEDRMTAKLGPPPASAPAGTGAGAGARRGRASWLLANENFDLYLARPEGSSPAPPAVEDAAVEALLAEPVVAHVYRASELAALPDSQPIEATLGAIGIAEGEPSAVSASRSGPDVLLPLMRASWSAGRSGDIVFRIQPGWLLEPEDLAASHGTPYFNDTHVTLLLRAPGVPPATRAERVSVRQFAPTLARLLAATPPATVTAPPLPIRENR